MEIEDNKKESYIYLDFNDKIPQEFIKNEMFIRIADLNSTKPLVQVNDMVFQGTHDHSVGTNIFFNRTQNQDLDENLFLNGLKGKLELLKTQTKVINCKQMRVTTKEDTTINERRTIKYNFEHDYKELLKKFEDGTLNLNDMIISESDIIPEPVDQEVIEKRKEEPEEEEFMEEPCPVEETDQKRRDLAVSYQKLQLLARQPVQRIKVKEDVEPENKYKKQFDYKGIECKVIDRPFFSYFKNNNTTSNLINIERCVRLGLLRPSDMCPRILNEEEEKVVVTIENLDNLDLELRLSIFSSYVVLLEKQLALNSEEANSIKDIYGNTPLETLDIYKKLVVALQKRIEEIKSIES